MFSVTIASVRYHNKLKEPDIRCSVKNKLLEYFVNHVGTPFFLPMKFYIKICYNLKYFLIQSLEMPVVGKIWPLSNE